MDSTQLMGFLKPMFDDRVVGCDAEGNTYGPALCPELSSYMTARLGDLCPSSAREVVYGLYPSPGDKRNAAAQSKRVALAMFLREVADDLLRPIEDRRIT